MEKGITESVQGSRNIKPWCEMCVNLEVKGLLSLDVR